MAAPVDWLMLAVGEHPKTMGPDAANTAARLVRILIPTDGFWLWLPGFDDDPRELWEIPEARAQVQLFAKAAFADGFDPLLDKVAPESVAILLKCDCFPNGCKYKDRSAGSED